MHKKPDRALGPGDPARSDAELAEAARAGGKRAFVEIVARHQGMVTGIALAILRDFAASEDAAQEAFLTAWQKMGDLREPAKLRSWLATIARRVALMHLRRRDPEARIDPEGDPLGGEVERPDESVASSEEAAMVLSALEALPENYRLPLVLFYREEKSIRAVAETLELSEDAVKQRLSRGREMLRERVAGLIDTVLGRSMPTVVFTMTIAAAIGALVAPGVVASAVFSSAAAGTTAAAAASTSLSSTTAATSTGVLTATATATTMSISKLSLTAAAIAAICIPIGFTARMSTEPEADRAASSAPAGGSVVSGAPEPDSPPELPDTPLVAEWKRLLAEHGAEPESFPRFHEVLERMDDPFRKRAFLSALIAEWAKVDPDRGIAYFRGDGRSHWQRELFVKEWVQSDPAGAVAGLQASGDGWEKLVRGQLSRIAEQAPGLIPALVAKLPKPERVWDTQVRDAFAILARGDLTGSRAAAEAITGASRTQALAGVAVVWAEKNGAESFEWAKSQGEGEERFEVMRASLIGWAKADPAAALERVELIPAGGDGMFFASSTGAKVLRAASESDFDATVAWLRKNPGKLGREDLTGLSGAVTSRLVADPTGFLAHAISDGSFVSLQPAIDSALMNDASVARLEIWEWLRTEPEGGVTNRLRETVMNGLGWREPRLAMRLVDELPAGEKRDRMLQQTAQRILNGGQNIAILEPLLDEVSTEWREQLLQAGFMTLRPDQFYDPQKWLERLDEIPAEVRSGAVSSLARAWSGQDPEVSAAWVESLDKAEERMAGIRAVATQWAQTDSYAASGWIAEMPPGDDRDAAARGLVGAIAQSEPEEAWEWAESIGSDEHKFSAAGQVLGVLVKRDREAALQWLGDSALPQAEKDRLAAQVESGKINSPYFR